MIIKIVSYVPTERLKNWLDIRATHTKKGGRVIVLVTSCVETAF